MQQYSTRYIFFFSAALCLCCSLTISVAYVGLRERQEINKQMDKKKSVLQACHLMEPGEDLSRQQVEERFAAITPRVIDLASGQYVEDIDAAEFRAEDDPGRPAPDNPAQLTELPTNVQVFEVNEEDKVEMLVLPIYGKGLWGTLYGFLALNADGNTVEGITYYEHKETPGLGGEVDNPKWKDRWPGRKVYKDGEVALQVIKGSAGPPEEDPYRVDGLSGATITSRGVSNMIKFWMGDEGYGPFLKHFTESRSV